MEKRIMLVFGTRPELIKLAPLIWLIRSSSLAHITLIVNTGQHDELLEHQLTFWKIAPDISFSLTAKANLVEMLSATLLELQKVLSAHRALEYLIVQGDTNTALAVAQSSFLNNKKLLHIEAGLRSGNLSNPFPEEFNRIVASKVAYFHFAPSALAKQNLVNEGIDPQRIKVIGNTAIDALKFVLQSKGQHEDTRKPQILITLHRRENISGNHLHLIGILKQILERYPSLQITWVLHPNCSATIKQQLNDFQGIHLMDAIPYDEFISQYASSILIITDSGGVIEEATELGIPTVVFREYTERLEPVENHYPMVVTIDEKSILEFIDTQLFKPMEPGIFYGKGDASEKIMAWMQTHIAHPLGATTAFTNSV